MFEEIIQDKNKLLCDRYNELTKGYNNALDKIIALQEIDLHMLEKVVIMGKTRDIYKFRLLK